MTSGIGRRVRPRRARRAVPALVVAGFLFLLVGIAVPGPVFHRPPGLRSLATGGPGGGGVTGVVNATINATDAPSFSPSTLDAAPGNLVHLKVTDQGQLNHTLTLVQTANVVLNRNATPEQVYAFFAKNGIWANLSLTPGLTVWANLTLPATSGGGSYLFLSVVPYQFQAGMSGYLNVSAAPVGPPIGLTESTVNSLNFVPNALVVSATSYPVSVRVLVTNLGNVVHTWTLAALPGYNLSSGDFTQFFQVHPPLANAQVPASSGGSVWANFTVNQKGVYEYICTVPSHFASGMYGFLYVGENYTPPPPPPSTDIVQPVVLYAGAGLLGVGILVAVVSALSGRFSTGSRSKGH